MSNPPLGWHRDESTSMWPQSYTEPPYRRPRPNRKDPRGARTHVHLKPRARTETPVTQAAPVGVEKRLETVTHLLNCERVRGERREVELATVTSMLATANEEIEQLEKRCLGQHERLNDKAHVEAELAEEIANHKRTAERLNTHANRANAAEGKQRSLRDILRESADRLHAAAKEAQS